MEAIGHFSNGRTMTAQEFKQRAEELTDEMQCLIEDNLPQKGNASWECQKIALLNALIGLEIVINGVEDSDFIEEE